MAADGVCDIELKVGEHVQVLRLAHQPDGDATNSASFFSQMPVGPFLFGEDPAQCFLMSSMGVSNSNGRMLGFTNVYALVDDDLTARYVGSTDVVNVYSQRIDPNETWNVGAWQTCYLGMCKDNSEYTEMQSLFAEKWPNEAPIDPTTTKPSTQEKPMTNVWAALILALLSFFTSKKSGASDSKALLTAGLVGAGTYYVANETEWGQENLDWFSDDKQKPSVTTTVPVTNSSGQPVKDSNGNIVYKVVDSAGKVLESWGGTGTAAVIGAGAVAADDSLRKYLPWVLIGAAFLILKK